MKKLRLPLVACLLAASSGLSLAAEEGSAGATFDSTLIEQLTAEQAALYMQAEGLFQQAQQQYKRARVVEARDLVQQLTYMSERILVLVS